VSDDKPTGDDGSGSTTAAARIKERQARDEQFIAAVAKGDSKAFGKLVDAWFDHVYDYASARGATGDALTNVARQAFETTWKALQGGGATPTLGATVMQATRTALGPAKKRKMSGAGAEEKLSRATDASAVVKDAGVAGILWDGATVLGDRVRDVLDLHYRHGLTAEEIGAVIGMPADKTRDLLAKIPNGYANAVRARVLWRGGTPEHEALAEELKQSGANGFDDKAVRAIHAHTRTCDQCRARALIALPPVDVFGDLPIAMAPAGLKEKAVIALATAGLDVTGSAYYVEAKVAAAGDDKDSTKADDWREKAKASAEAATQAVVAEASQRAARALAKEGAALGATTTDDVAKDKSTEDKAKDEGSKNEEEEEKKKKKKVAAGVGGSAGAAAEAAAEPAEPEPASTPSPEAVGEESAAGSKRWAAVGAAAAVLVLIIVVVLMTRGGKDDKTQLAASEESTTTTASASTTTTANATGSTTAGPSTTDVVSTTSSSAVTSSTTAGLNTTTTALSTTTTVPLNVTANLTMAGGAQPNRRTVNYPMTDAPSLNWSVVANKPVNVVVKDYNGNVLSVDLTGSVGGLCPGPVTPENKCGAPVGNYSWTLTVTTPQGQVVAAQTQTLRITP
jgi:DNA-directed RNA polymerase specialized sigma24 family protein